MISFPKPDAARHDAKFAEMLPLIEQIARRAFRRCRAEAREELVAEVVANSFCAFRRMVEMGRHNLAFATPLARFAVMQIRNGRRVGSCMGSGDVMSVASIQRGITVERMSPAQLADCLASKRTPVAERAAFRIDFPAWFDRQPKRERQLIAFLAIGNSALAAARRFGVSAARISQIRRALDLDWQEYQGN